MNVWFRFYPLNLTSIAHTQKPNPGHRKYVQCKSQTATKCQPNRISPVRVHGDWQVDPDSLSAQPKTMSLRFHHSIDRSADQSTGLCEIFHWTGTIQFWLPWEWLMVINFSFVPWSGERRTNGRNSMIDFAGEDLRNKSIFQLSQHNRSRQIDSDFGKLSTKGRHSWMTFCFWRQPRVMRNQYIFVSIYCTMNVSTAACCRKDWFQLREFPSRIGPFNPRWRGMGKNAFNQLAKNGPKIQLNVPFDHDRWMQSFKTQEWDYDKALLHRCRKGKLHWKGSHHSSAWSIILR